MRQRLADLSIRVLTLCTIALLAPAGLSRATASETPPFEAFRTASAEQRLRPRAPTDPAAAARELGFQARCNPDKRRAATVALRWRPASAAGARGQRVELTKFREGFESGTFEVTDHLPLASAAVAVDAPEPGVNYYWRVVTETPGGWTTSPTERFEVPVCPWDGEELEPPAGPPAAVPEGGGEGSASPLEGER